MLITMWDKGLKGKVWRILKNLSTNLTAVIKTRFGLTREILMEIGGRQGSRLTGRLFAKMMDLLAEEFEGTEEGFKFMSDFKIAILLWVDDVVSCTEGKENQEKMLKKVDVFARKHKLKWGSHKCNIMKVGGHNNEMNEWKLGELTIDETTEYKYLGDTLTNDGKNTKNLEVRGNKIKGTSITINTIAANEVLKKVETGVLLELHEKVNIPSLLMNAESWNLNSKDKEEMRKIEIQALKTLFDLPIHTPNPAIYYAFGILHTDIQVDKRRLTYLHKLITRDLTHWTHKALNTLTESNIGWAKSIGKTLETYNLPTEYNVIKTITQQEWKRRIIIETEKQHILRLKEDCHKKEKGELRVKTKTASILDHITRPTYKRQPIKELLECTKHETKTIISARYRMLECGQNFKGTISEKCDLCDALDDENHRLNYCSKYRDTNFFDDTEKADFNAIYSNNVEILREIIPKIERVWNLRTAHGIMNR